MAAMAIPGTLLMATSVIDNAWSMVLDRADKAGVILAQANSLPSSSLPWTPAGFQPPQGISHHMVTHDASLPALWRHHSLTFAPPTAEADVRRACLPARAPGWFLNGRAPDLLLPAGASHLLWLESPLPTLHTHLHNPRALFSSSDLPGRFQELERCGARGVVREVVLLGGPISIIPKKWCAARSVVSGRFVNAYCKNDWLLGIVFRTTRAFVK